MASGRLEGGKDGSGEKIAPSPFLGAYRGYWVPAIRFASHARKPRAGFGSGAFSR